MQKTTTAQIQQLLHNNHQQQQMDHSVVAVLPLPFDAVSAPSSSGQPPLFSPNSSDTSPAGGGDHNSASQSSATDGGGKMLTDSFLLDQKNESLSSQMANGKGMTAATAATEEAAAEVEEEAAAEVEEEAAEVEAVAQTSAEVKDRGEEKETETGENSVHDRTAEKETDKEEIAQESMPNAKKEKDGENDEERRRQNGSESKTTDLIRKQLAEIEREIARRMQNKNVKKMDEQEMNQLLLNHGFGFQQQQQQNGKQQQKSDGRRGDEQQTQKEESALPFGDSPEPKLATNSPSLDQLHQSLISPQLSVSQHPLYFPQPFVPGGQMPFSVAGVHFPHQQTMTPSFLTQMCPQEQFAMPHHFAAPPPATLFGQSPHHPFRGAPFSVPFLPQQPTSPPPPAGTTQSPSPPFAQMLSPSLSDITPEMAAQLLAQLQQHNPSLLQNLVMGQQHQQQQIQQQHQTQLDSFCADANPLSPTVTSRSASISNGPLSSIGGNSSVAPSPLPAPPRGPQSSVASRRASSGREQPARRSFSGKSGTPDEVGAQKQRQTMEWPGGSAEKGATTTSSNSNTEKDKTEPIWVMRESYLKRREREEQRRQRKESDALRGKEAEETEREEGKETDKLLLNGRTTEGTAGGQIASAEEEKGTERSENGTTKTGEEGEEQQCGNGPKRKGSKKEVIIHEPAVLIEGVLFRARYLGSTQMSSDGRPTKSSRMAQAQEAVARVKAPDGELQPSTEIDLFISTEKIMVLNTDLQRISETDVRQDILMDHSLRSISYIADIGDLVVLMARRVPSQQEQTEDEAGETIRKSPRVICHVFESEESAFIAQSIGQAFQVAYVEFLRANGIEDPNYLRDIDYQEVLNSQELLGEELEMLARKETQKDVVVSKKLGETLGIVVVESGWGSMLPTVVIANMAPGGAASRSNQLNIGDQLIGINGISLVGLPLSAAQQNIKNVRSSTAVRLTVVSTPPVVEVRIRRPDTKYQLGFSVQNGVICSLLRGGIAERGGIRVGHRIIEINHLSVVAIPHERIVNMLATATGEIHMKTMPTSMFRLLTGQEIPNYI